tara:strand:- start:69 stop:677 length:609 start_codon:yes stop_codon:yes gene_type:complete
MKYEYKYYHWGPFLFRINIDPSDLKKIKNLCAKKEERLTRNTLAGNIKGEYEIDAKEVENIIRPYLTVFGEGYKRWYNSPHAPIAAAKSAWVNYMKAGEHNPVHVHQDCDLSSVIFIDVPKKLKTEIANYEGTTHGPGCITFLYGEVAPFFISSAEFEPQVGDMFIFPYSLRHTVNPFKSKCERISVAVNYLIKNKKESVYD